MTDPLILQYLKDIKEAVTRVEDKQDIQDNRLNGHDLKFERQSGVMIGGGAVVTFFAGLAAWVVDHWSKS